jgi:hypothetical protein
MLTDPPSDPDLLPFGVAAGDLPGPRGDDSASNRVTLEVPFTFIGTEYSQIVVSIGVSEAAEGSSVWGGGKVSQIDTHKLDT